MSKVSKTTKPKTPCEKCGKEITTTQLHSHTGSKACNYNLLGERRKAQVQGFVKFTQYEEIGQLVNYWAIPEGKIIAHQYEAYVPKWIGDAYLLYKKNKGYAGLDFLEFLNKMRAEAHHLLGGGGLIPDDGGQS